MGLYNTIRERIVGGEETGRDDRTTVDELIGGGPVTKASVDDYARTPKALTQTARKAEAVPRPNDPIFLRELAKHTIAQAYIDTISQDVGSAPWSIRSNGEQVEKPRLERVERELRTLHEEMSWSSLIERTTANFLTVGDSPWILSRGESSGDLRGVSVPDPASVFKVLGEFGETTGYLQVSRSDAYKSRPVEKDDVVWFSWSQHPDAPYGLGPIEKGQTTLELLNELERKEITDLRQGSQSGILSRVSDDEMSPTSEEEFRRLKKGLQLNDDERYVSATTKGKWEYTPLNPSYGEMLILDRNKWWSQVLASVFKVSASYAGLNPENVNRATDESQQSAYRQKGFRVTLSLIEDRLNRDLIWPEFGEDVRFEFVREQSVEEQTARVEYYSELGTAANRLSALGLDVMVRDDQLVVEDGAVESVEGGFDDEIAQESPSVDAVKSVEASVADVDEVTTRVAKDFEADWSSDATDVMEVAIATSDVEGFDAPDGLRSSFVKAVKTGLDGLDVVDGLADEYPGASREDFALVARVFGAAIIKRARDSVGLDTEGYVVPDAFAASAARVEDAMSRTARQREFEAAFNAPLSTVLQQLEREAGSRASVPDYVSDHEDIEGTITRQTLYNWLEETGLK